LTLENTKHQSQKDYLKKILSDSLRQVDFSVGLADSVRHLPNKEVMFLGNILEEIQ